MAAAMTFEEETEDAGIRRFLLPFALAVAAAIVIWFVWSGLDQRTGVARPTAPQTTVDLLPPPPPPPPPPPEEKPQPTEVKQPSPTPSPAPEPSPQAPAPVSINAPATAGADSFGLQSGNGGGIGAPGSIGTCVGTKCGGGGGGLSDSFYRSYLSSALQNALRRNKAVRGERFSIAVMIWISAAGAVTRAELASGSGDSGLDDKVLTALRAVDSLRPPQEGVRFPQRTIVRGTTS